MTLGGEDLEGFTCAAPADHVRRRRACLLLGRADPGRPGARRARAASSKLVPGAFDWYLLLGADETALPPSAAGLRCFHQEPGRS